MPELLPGVGSQPVRVRHYGRTNTLTLKASASRSLRFACSLNLPRYCFCCGSLRSLVAAPADALGSRTTAGLEAYCPLRGGAVRQCTGTEESVWSLASSSSASRSAVTAHGVATDSLDLPCLAATGRGFSWILEGPSDRARIRVLVHVAITGPEGMSRDHLWPAPGGVERETQEMAPPHPTV